MVLDPQELWHQGTRPSPLDPFRHATLWRSRLSATPAAAPGRCGRMPWTWLSPVEVAKSSASFITRPSWGSETLRLHRRKPLKSSCCTQLPIIMSCDVMCFCARSPCRWPRPWASKGLFAHQRSEGQCVVGTRQGHSSKLTNREHLQTFLSTANNSDEAFAVSEGRRMNGQTWPRWLTITIGICIRGTLNRKAVRPRTRRVCLS